MVMRGWQVLGFAGYMCVSVHMSRVCALYVCIMCACGVCAFVRGLHV